jgi:hypothetical protein
LSGSTSKKVLVERFDREPLRGFVNPQSYLAAQGIELMSPDGSLAVILFESVKAVCFVRELEGPSLSHERREFLARPKSAGLWVDLLFRDGDRMEGLIPNNLLQIEGVGFVITPPESAGNTQKVFIPRQALREISVLGVVGSRLKDRRPKQKAKAEQQITLFSEDVQP